MRTNFVSWTSISYLWSMMSFHVDRTVSKLFSLLVWLGFAHLGQSLGDYGAMVHTNRNIFRYLAST